MFEKQKDNSASEIEKQKIAKSETEKPKDPTLENIHTVREVMIGTTIKIKGEITGDEDLLVEGSIEGSIDLSEFDLTIGQSGNVTAEVRAKTVKVEGHVTGDIHASQNVLVTKSARMVGNIKAPRVSLEDGAEFKGSIDMHAGTETPVVAAGATPINRDQATDTEKH